MRHTSLVIANWKANFTSQEAFWWLKTFEEEIQKKPDILLTKEVVICPSFTLFAPLSEYLKKLSLALCSQDISRFGKGPYTGEVPAEYVAEYASFTLVGHLERRTLFEETGDILKQKTILAFKAGLVPIYCLSDIQETLPEGITHVAYEPQSAVGTGKADDPGKINEIAKKLKKGSVQKVLYGGSVTSENVASFLQGDLDGVLVGKASLDPLAFVRILESI